MTQTHVRDDEQHAGTDMSAFILLSAALGDMAVGTPLTEALIYLNTLIAYEESLRGRGGGGFKGDAILFRLQAGSFALDAVIA